MSCFLYNWASGSLKARANDMRNLSVMEQHAHSIAVKKPCHAFVVLAEFEDIGILHQGVRCLYDRLKGVLDDAKSIWHFYHQLLDYNYKYFKTNY